MIESERTFIFRNFGGRKSRWCEGCQAITQMASVGHASMEAGLNELAIYQLLDTGALHYTQDAEGQVLVCLNSLLK